MGFFAWTPQSAHGKRTFVPIDSVTLYTVSQDAKAHLGIDRKGSQASRIQWTTEKARLIL